MERKSALTLLEPAKTLDEVHKTLSPQPLLTPAEIRAFYRGGINKVRGGDKARELALELECSGRASFCKACLAGHPGVGKSTELTRLAEQVSGRFRPIRFRVTEELDPISFKPFDILFLMMMRVVEETAKPVGEGGAGGALSEDLLRTIIDWFAREETINSQSWMTDVEVSPGIGPHATDLWQRIASLFTTIKGEMRFAAARSKEVIQFRLERLWTLVDLVNSVLNECNDRLREAAGCEWLFIGEEFDIPAIPVARNQNLFFDYSSMLRNMECHSIFTIPMDLVYSQRADQMPSSGGRIHILSDTPVLGGEHGDSRKGRAALKEILEARVSPKLFGSGQMKRLIIASGGNLRDLFAMVSIATDHAILCGSISGKIGSVDTGRAINKYRDLQKDKLGYSTSVSGRVTYRQKADRLLAIYQQEPEARIPDPVLDVLLSSGIVQGFDGERGFGVHPLVVDILKEQGKLVAGMSGKVAGGTA